MNVPTEKSIVQMASPNRLTCVNTRLPVGILIRLNTPLENVKGSKQFKHRFTCPSLVCSVTLFVKRFRLPLFGDPAWVLLDHHRIAHLVCSI